MNKKILIVSCTQKSDCEDTLLWKSLDWIGGRDEWYDVQFVAQNKEGLPLVYNRFITPHKAALYESIVFVHDDVWIDDSQFADKLNHAFTFYDIVGVAGCLNPTIQHPALWHIMSDRKDHRGQAGHFINQQKTKDFGEPCYMTSFGVTPSRTALIDGVFMAINVHAALRAEWKWNENFTFHHYDIASCIDANDRGLRIGVYPINIYHASPGLKSLEDPVWNASNKKFLELYA